MWAIWDFGCNDYVRELPSKVNEGGIAILAFEDKEEAQDRARRHWGCENITYRAFRQTGNGRVVKLKKRKEIVDEIR